MFNNVKSLSRLALVAVLSVGICGFVVAPNASADERDQMSIVTFNAPVEVPGTILPAGTYVFKLIQNTDSQNVVQIMDQNETHVYATVVTVPDLRMRSTDKTVVEFSERPPGSVEAIKAWFYPGRHTGLEFLYGNSDVTRPIEAE